MFCYYVMVPAVLPQGPAVLQQCSCGTLIWSHYVRPTAVIWPNGGGKGSEGPDTGGLVSPRVRGISPLNICLGGTDVSSISSL